MEYAGQKKVAKQIEKRVAKNEAISEELKQKKQILQKAIYYANLQKKNKK